MTKIDASQLCGPLQSVSSLGNLDFFFSYGVFMSEPFNIPFVLILPKITFSLITRFIF